MKKVLISIGLIFIWTVIVFYWLHLTAVITRGLFWSNWFVMILGSVFLSVVGINLFMHSHHLYSSVGETRGKLFVPLCLNLGTALGLGYATGYFGNFTNAFSWDDKEFLLSSLWFAAPIKTMIVSVPFLALIIGNLYVGFVALWIGYMKRPNN